MDGGREGRFEGWEDMRKGEGGSRDLQQKPILKPSAKRSHRSSIDIDHLTETYEAQLSCSG